MTELGAQPVHLPLPEAPHRGYGSAPALFGEQGHDDLVGQELLQLLDSELGTGPCDLLLAPQGLGRHVDHRIVRTAAEAWASCHRLPLALWRDAPYVLRSPEPSTGPELGVRLTPESLQAKILACRAYASQVGFQFGHADAVPAAVQELASTDARRLGTGTAAEAFVADDRSARLLGVLG